MKPTPDRCIQRNMKRLAVLLLGTGIALAGELDLRELVRRSVEIDEKNWEMTIPYSYRERVEKDDLDQNGESKKHDVKSFDVVFLEGTSYRRLISRFDKPLSPEEEASEEAKFTENRESRRNETTKQRDQRTRSWEKKRNENRRAILEIPDAFDFRLIGEETIRSRPAWVLDAMPRPGFEPKDSRARLFTKMHGKLWIDKETGAWLRLEGQLMDTVTVGWILVRIHEGAHVRVDSTLLEDGVWMPQLLSYTISLRIGLVKLIRVRQESFYGGFRKVGPDGTQIRLAELTPPDHPQGHAHGAERSSADPGSR